MKSYHWLWILGVIFLVFGVYREEIANILTNATMICFSCIGLE